MSTEPYTPTIEDIRLQFHLSLDGIREDGYEIFDRMLAQVRREAAAEQREKDAQIARSVAEAVWVQDSYAWDDESEMSPDERAAADLGAQRAYRAIREQGSDA